MSIATYDPKMMLTSFKGINISGFAEGTFLEIDRNEDTFTFNPGINGTGARTLSNNRSGTVKFTLQQHSQTNDLLSAVAVADERLGTGVGPFFAKEFNGTTVSSAANAWIKKIPQTSRAKEFGQVEWMLECEDLEMFVGGLVVT